MNEMTSWFPWLHRRPPGPSRMQEVEKTATHTQCLIIGAGHNGLSVAAGLRKRGVEPILLEQHARIGDQWRERYERLHLHHITDAMHLPGVPYPSHLPRYLSRLDLADYLESYARLHELDVRFEHKVSHLAQKADGTWEATVTRGDDSQALHFTADQVVLAAGSTGVTPRSPSLKGRQEWAGQVLHSQEYRNAEEFEGKRVLVVGSGNSALEICGDLYDHGASTSMLIRGPNSWITREAYAIYHRLMLAGGPILKYVPFTWIFSPFILFALDRYFQFDIKRRYGDLSSKGIYPMPSPPMWVMAKSEGAHPPSYVDGTWGDVGVSIFELIRDDKLATFTSEISHLEPGTQTVVFKNGQSAEFDAVILCTGFEPIQSHYATFVDAQVAEKLSDESKFRFLDAMEELPGLWVSLGGIASSRFGQDVLAARVAARVKGRPAPGRVLSLPMSFVFAGLDPMQVQVPRRTIAINALALIAIIAAML